jgi:hypothetical protein
MGACGVSIPSDVGGGIESTGEGVPSAAARAAVSPGSTATEGEENSVEPTNAPQATSAHPAIESPTTTGPVDVCEGTCQTVERPAEFSWNGKVLIQDDAGRSESYGASYVDSNDNGVFDEGDAGNVAPGSTVKIGVALAALEANGGRGGIEELIVKALVVSDNTAANTLMDVAGGPAGVTEALQARGLTPFVVGRYFGFPSGRDARCSEGGRLGNCASAAALIRSLRAVVEPGWFPLPDGDRLWLLEVLASTPADHGFGEPDDYCRYVRLPGLQKCGVSPFEPQSFSNLAYFPDQGLYAFAVVTPPAGTSEAAAAAEIDSMTRRAIDAFAIPGNTED